MRFSDLRFDCHGCGRCCRTDWEIPVENPAFPVRRDACGACLYLDGHGCRLHGTPHKPRACQLFPFQAVATPDGVYVGASLYCPSIYHGRGRPLREHRLELPDLPVLATGPLQLNDQETIGWSGYKLLEEGLHALLPHLWGAVARLGSTAGKSLEELLVVEIVGRPSPHATRYLAELLHRKYLLTGPGRNLRENLGLLALIPYVLREPVEDSVAVLERDFYTHAAGAGAWLPSLRRWLR